MTPIDRMLAEYAADHRHPVNQRLHTICVPVIFVSLLGLLRAVPVPGTLAGLPSFVNWAVIAVVAALLWYFSRSPRYGVAMTAASAIALWMVALLDQLPLPLAASSAGLFVVAWIGQFIGHGYEGRRPSFFRDLQFLLVGPLWVLAKLFPRLAPRG